MNDDNVKPTDLQNNDITRFGQENINYTNKSTSNVVASDSSVFNKKNEYFNIGKVPPGATEDPDKEKRKLKRLLFILIVFIVIALIGFGIHFYLSKTRTIAENAVKTKDVTIGINEKLSLKLDDYATFKKVNPANCILNTKNVDTSKIGKYEFVISCGVNKYSGKITVVDTVAPVILTHPVVKNKNSDLSVNDFVIECSDDTKCHLELENFDQLKEQIVNNDTGIFDAYIKARDDKKNVSKSFSSVFISSEASNVYSCVAKDLKVDSFNGTFISIDNYIIANNVATNIINYYIFEFNSQEDYKNKIAEIDDSGNLTINNITGKAYYDDNRITLMVILDINGISYLPKKDIESIKSFYSKIGYKCELY